MNLFKKGHPLEINYPCEVAEIQGVETTLVNPCDGQHHGVPEPFRAGTPEWLEETNAMVRLRLDVQMNKWPDWYLDFCGVDTELSPVLKMTGLSMSDPQGCAGAVHMDQPQELWMACLRYITQSQSYIEHTKEFDSIGDAFLERNVDSARIFSDLLELKMRQCFEVKYYYGVERPEEYFATNMTHYYEGCPNHPSYIAGHATVGGVVNRALLSSFLLKGSPEADDIETATKQFAHFRDFAGVHLRQDSREGWNFGNL